MGQQASVPTKMPATTAPAQTANAADANKPKPCCVCKDEKAARDECMLFSNAKDPAEDCKTKIEQYKSCMAGFGFKV
ncbi:Cytochrome c oxidase copper chaperone [Pyricularia oryzae]|uniref:COX17 protein n=3 Tax=Pyricularia oryzae TaxID=318829 RepID=G4MQM7_PYRO7|nr:COX17 protein [Pyricularia oryzae 70-15]KAH8841953.1 Cytochrome c oxidase copper chaperone [Pyricularia oryzae]EHA57314.1 COX17 protein [Pyricularia oryzae 70-15]KAI6255547.1 Cytochrome c oxidase copper chaperone [Pyricularia oryzae]KAI6276313.1 Cytochrome c oxidase copper chaperone [Pyricularia oryzae]KAI6311929.1 Cytochrome c oxidase copper chaperone [Pyricularia oryzae]